MHSYIIVYYIQCEPRITSVGFYNIYDYDKGE